MRPPRLIVRVLRVVPAAYVALVVAHVVIGTLANGVAGSWPAVPPPTQLVAMALFYATSLLGALIANLPLLAILRLARLRVAPLVGRLIIVAGFVAWAEWMLYRWEWFDVWRHGTPGLSYWLTTIVPWGVAFGSAGSVVGGAGVVHLRPPECEVGAPTAGADACRA